MDLIQNADVCANSGSDLCDVIYNVTGSERFALTSSWLIAKPAAILSLVLLALIARWVLYKVIDRVVDRAAEGMVPKPLSRGRRHDEKSATAHAAMIGSLSAQRRVQRAKAMGSMLKSVVTSVILVMVLIMVISELGYDVAPLIASAGVVGLALGFGAQSLVKDYLAGIFMIFEDQYGVGDVVDLGEASGTVEAVSLRITRLRDVDGTVWYVRNGEILRVGNMSQNWARTVLDVRVGYDEDLRRVQKILKDVAHGLWEDEEYKRVIIEEPEVWGVQSLDPESIVVRVTLKTAPLEQWDVAREMRERVKARFDYEGIVMPLPQRMVWHRDAPDRAAADDTDAAALAD